jgi:hypothetical protein
MSEADDTIDPEIHLVDIQGMIFRKAMIPPPTPTKDKQIAKKIKNLQVGQDQDDVEEEEVLFVREKVQENAVLL